MTLNGVRTADARYLDGTAEHLVENCLYLMTAEIVSVHLYGGILRHGILSSGVLRLRASLSSAAQVASHCEETGSRRRRKWRERRVEFLSTTRQRRAPVYVCACCARLTV